MSNAPEKAKSWRSRRLSELGSSIFAEVAAWKRAAAAGGVDMIDLGIGSPDQPPAEAVREALAAAALRKDTYAYPATKSGMPFKEAAAAWMKFRFGVEADPSDEIVTLLGSQDGLAHLAMAICDPGDAALLPDPGYPIYSASLALAGVEPILMPLRAENGYMPDLEAIDNETWRRAKFILVNYPNNPLSAVADLAFFEKLLAKAREHGVLVVHDLAYSEMGFDGSEPPSILQVQGAKGQAVEFHSMSKSFNMAGCRLGFLVGNSEAVGALRELKANIDYGAFDPVQEAAIVALNEAMSNPAYERAGELYERRRDAFVDALHAEGWKVDKPSATMFVWARLPDMTWDLGQPWTSRTISQEMLKTTGVVVVPGEAFGVEGQGYVRIALVESEERLLEAAARIGRFIRGEHVIK
ncbi:aminotransferase class I/II-fold pyridoxal phosphate-dependent enzyme [Paenibacillus soyae]|uniref:Aminotransferase n=1 Tax=Paenibacillus soyae TaxID=2969249 RepID=A0A9X2S992_9BACL|nr:aminotransferase class I/II-fold pyridoxal phosphate-dependent enzyme [Paenibacillus soyae]MCR2802477.1 aminotransferase class I/II-fold pyridoxal phosphate-dependent enzyme [Paenibacillus soyae]